MFKLEFETDNDAFADDPRGEAVRILQRVKNAIYDGASSGNIRDINGNTIGHWEFTP